MRLIVGLFFGFHILVSLDDDLDSCPRNSVTLWSTIKFLREIALVNQSPSSPVALESAT